ncbi:DnaD domain protein [Neobacillus kokaensis]|uniref:Uncharacterized protein n=1 Tax=Neobacillus kokaensis TaxID=2759023 RepID=A0ABQ3N8E0_9BACI|nr:DnaD domain protein [Neobacillus kokaensis]GHH99792.1 hypothetical protein AM1BK_33350 [Neobacillus kokaensis]
MEKQNAEFEQSEKAIDKLLEEKYKKLGFTHIFEIQPKELCSFKQTNTKRDQIIKYYEETGPFYFFRDRFQGVEPSMKDIRTIEDIMIKYRLTPGVVNAIIDFIVLKTDRKFITGLFDSLCAHYARLKIKTVPEAMKKFTNFDNTNRSEKKEAPLTRGQEVIIERLLVRVEQLEARVTELEKQLFK